MYSTDFVIQRVVLPTCLPATSMRRRLGELLSLLPKPCMFPRLDRTENSYRPPAPVAVLWGWTFSFVYCALGLDDRWALGAPSVERK